MRLPSAKHAALATAVILASLHLAAAFYAPPTVLRVSAFSGQAVPGLRRGNQKRNLGLKMQAEQEDRTAQTNRRSSVFRGMPSTPGWKDKLKDDQFEKLTDWAVSSQANRPIICEYEPDGLWLWSKWEGTVLSLTIRPVLIIMALSTVLDASVHTFAASNWPIMGIPPADDVTIMQLQGISKLWEYILTLATFILTFFTSEAYRYWQKQYSCTRCIQGRINDICMLITMGAERGPYHDFAVGADGKVSITSGFSDEADDLVKRCTRLIKLSHVFFWAATPTRSNGVVDAPEDKDFDHENIGPLLLSPEGLDGLIEAGELTYEEKLALVNSGLPATQYAYVLMEWVGLYAMEGIRAGVLGHGMTEYGLQENLLRQLNMLRAEYFNIGDYTAGRMVLAYVQLVQVLVDSLVALAPFALYPQLGSLSIPLSGFLTLFFKGLLELSKSFLDPYGVEESPAQNIRIDVLVSELNFGAGSRWVKAAECLPKPRNLSDDPAS